MKDFVPYQEALALRELGFDEPCFGWYSEDKKLIRDFVKPQHELEFVLAPTYSQAFRWFREKYRLHQYIRQYYGDRFYFHIEDMAYPRRWDEYPLEMLRSLNESTSQEEAELACLRKLIEIVKTQKS